jgi:hypothetical protein
LTVRPPAQAAGGAIRAGYRALTRSVFDLVQDFAEAEATAERKALVQTLTNAAEHILEIVVRRHERRSIVITTSRPTEAWGQFRGDVPAATAILDRFLARIDIVQLEGKSCRLHQRAQRGAQAGQAEAQA